MLRRLQALLTLIFLSLRAVLIMALGAIVYAVLRLAGRAPGQHSRTADSLYQTEESQRGEVVYRKRAAFGQPEAVFQLVQTRMERRTLFQSLVQRGVALSPYAELGAERGQTSLLLNVEFGAVGAATDLSVHSLQVIPILRSHFGYSTEPLAVCCDATHLPFRNGALSFVFCFATLHHFDDMRPVLTEVRRVLGKGGYFLFAEEPLKRSLCLNLYRCPRVEKMDSVHRFLHRHEFLQYIAEAFVGSREETEYGIVENQSVTLHQWEETLSIFDRQELDFALLATRDGFSFRSALMGWGMPEKKAQRLAADLYGCAVGGLCSVEQGADPVSADQFLEAFICPNCSKPLHFAGSFVCPSCGSFEQQGNVHMLLPRQIKDRLYPTSLSESATASSPL